MSSPSEQVKDERKTAIENGVGGDFHKVYEQWSTFHNDEGRIYYSNSATGEKSWNAPEKCNPPPLWAQKQEEMKGNLVLENQVDFDTADLGTVKLIGAVDIGYSTKDKRKSVPYIVVWDATKQDEKGNYTLIYEDFYVFEKENPLPYISGFLAFKEVPQYEPLFAKLPPQYSPQVLFVDGNGVFHPRGFGCACHVGIQFNIPTVGIAKKVCHVDGLNKKVVGELCKTHLKKRHDSVELRGESGTLHGYSMLCGQESKHPVHVSSGHRINQETSLALVKYFSGTVKIPEPIRQADLRGRAILMKLGL